MAKKAYLVQHILERRVAVTEVGIHPHNHRYFARHLSGGRVVVVSSYPPPTSIGLIRVSKPEFLD